MNQNDAKVDLNWSKTTQHNPKQLERRPRLTQNKLKQAKTSQKENWTYPKRLETSQNDSKCNKVFAFSRNKLSRIADLDA